MTLVRSPRELVEKWRRERGIEIVRFDARIAPSESVYAGAWQRSGRPHALKLGLSWGTFHRHHRRLVRKGRHELVHLKSYEVDGRRRVGAIWRPRTPGPSRPERARRAHDWQQLRRLDERLSPKGLHLAEIEAYPRPNGPDDRWAAGVWHSGRVEIRLLDGLVCNAGIHRPIEGSLEVRTPDRLCGTVEEKPFHSRCQLMLELEVQAEEGFQAVDFENYMEAGEERWAVLLHERSGPDWLQFAGTELDVALRELHNGLVHDGGTSGPP